MYPVRSRTSGSAPTGSAPVADDVHPGGPASALVGALAALVLLFALVAGAPPAFAHAQLVSTSPADGATVAPLPDRVEFVYNENINPSLGAQVVVAGPDGRNRTIENPTVDGPRVTAPMPADLGTGEMTVRYRVVSADGHPVAGEITFTVGPPALGGTATSQVAAPTSEADEPASTDTDTDSAAAAPTPSPSVMNPDEAADIEAGRPASQAPNIAPYALTGLAAVLLIGFGVFLLRSERRRR